MRGTLRGEDERRKGKEYWISLGREVVGLGSQRPEHHVGTIGERITGGEGSHDSQWDRQPVYCDENLEAGGGGNFQKGKGEDLSDRV